MAILVGRRSPFSPQEANLATHAQLQKQIAALRAEVVAEDIPVDRLRETVRLMRATIPPTPEAEDAAVLAAETLGGWWAGQAQRYHERQCAAFYSVALFRAIEAGRRSGKSHGRKVEIVTRALDPDWVGYTEYGLTYRNIVVGGPTQEQTLKLYWADLLRMIPKWAIRAVRKSVHQIEVITGAVIHVLGMDRPERSEGFPVHDLFLDEFADMWPTVWSDHLEPGLETRGHPPGTVCFFGTPDMKSGEHFIEICDAYALSKDPEEQHFRWSSIGILSEERLERLRRRMSKAQWVVQIEAGRATTGDRAYFEFDRGTHVVDGLRIVGSRPLLWCFDFNVRPGVAVVAQEQTWADYGPHDQRPAWAPQGLQDAFIAVVGEVYIPAESNTPAVVRALLDGWGDHPGRIQLHGDPAGGNRGTSQTAGSDWDQILEMTRLHFDDGVDFMVARAHPPIRQRVNTANRLLRDARDGVHMVVSRECPMTIRDFERVAIKEGTRGEIDKPKKGPGSELTHLTDGLGYCLVALYDDAPEEIDWS